MTIAQDLERAILHHRSGRLAEAQQGYQAVIAQEPENADAHHLLGQLLAGANRATEAVHHLEKAVELSPNEALYLRSLGLALRRQNRFREAADAFARADRAKPNDPVIKTNLADTFSAAGLYQQAVPLYREALALQADSPAIRRNLAQCFSLMGQHDEAVKEFQAVLQENPDDTVSRTRLGDVLREQGKSDAAIAAYQEARERGGDKAELQTKIGIVLQQTGRFEEAESAFRTVLDDDAGFAPALLNLSRQHRFTADDPLLGSMAGMLAEGSREALRPQIEFALARAYDQIGDSDRAFSLLQSANRSMAVSAPHDPAPFAALVEGLIENCGHAWRAGLASTSADDRPVFVVGMPRSGVSLVDELLCRHPQAKRSSDPGLIEQVTGEICGSGRLTSGFGSKLAAVAPEEAARLQARMTASLDAQADAGGDIQRIVTARPGYYINLGLIALMAPGARIVHCRRDPVDTCLSIYFQDYQQGHQYSYDLEQTAVTYLAYRQLMDHWLNTGVLPIHEVDYESLVTAPDEEMRRMLSFLGLEGDARCLDPSVYSGPIRSGALWDVRQPLHQASMRRWERYEEHLDPLFSVLASLLPQDEALTTQDVH